MLTSDKQLHTIELHSHSSRLHTSSSQDDNDREEIFQKLAEDAKASMSTAPKFSLELILQAMRTHAEDAEVCEQGCHAIVDLCRGTDDSGLQHKQHAASLGALDLLVDALRKFGPTDEHHLEACCLALSTLCTGSAEAGLQRKHTAAGAIELLIEPLRNAAEPKTQERGCALLRNLCTGQDERGLQRKKRAREAVSEEPKLPLL